MRVSNGLFVVINIAKFDIPDELPDRIGSEHDEKAMVELFGDHFKFDVNVSTRKRKKEIVQDLHKISSDKHNEEKDCLAVCVMSHGDESGFYTSDGKKIDYEKVISYFKNDRCKSFRGKPKLFIIQACRGGDVDRGVEHTVSDFPSQPTGNQSSAYCPKSPGTTCLIPREADTFVAFCCSEGYLSCRNTNTGSYYIQSLVKIFKDHSADEDVYGMLTMVHDEVGSQTMNLEAALYVKQAPELRSKLRKKVYLLPK